MRWSAIWSSPIASAGTALRSSDCRRLSNKLISSKTSPEVQLPLAPPSEHMFVVYRKSVRCQAFTRENSRQLLRGVHFATGPCSTAFSQSLGLVRLPTRRARCASWPTSPRGGEARYASVPALTPPSQSLGCMRLPTRRARWASTPTSPRGGEARYASGPVPTPLFRVFCLAVTPHPASSLREHADLPAWRGGEIRLRARPHSPFPVLGVQATPHPACSLREHADLPAWRGGEITSHFVGRRDTPPGLPALPFSQSFGNSFLPTRRAR